LSTVGGRKHDIAEEYLAKTTISQGLFLVLIGRAKAPVWDISANHRIEKKKPMPYVNHYSLSYSGRGVGTHHHQNKQVSQRLLFDHPHPLEPETDVCSKLQDDEPCAERNSLVI
jgi:hypothetical protein